MQKDFSDWLAIAALPTMIGITVALIPPNRGTAFLGTLAGSIAAVSITTYRKDQQIQANATTLQLLEAQAQSRDEFTHIQAILLKLKAEKQALESQLVAKQNVEVELAALNAKIKFSQDLARENDLKIESLKRESQNLENKIATLHQQNPSLQYKEELQKGIETLRGEKEIFTADCETM